MLTRSCINDRHKEEEEGSKLGREGGNCETSYLIDNLLLKYQNTENEYPPVLGDEKVDYFPNDMRRKMFKDDATRLRKY